MLAFSRAELELLERELDAAQVAVEVTTLQRRLQAVYDRQQALGEALEGVLPRIGGLGLGALAGVLGVRHGAHHGVALLLEPRMGFREQLLERLFVLRLNSLFLHLVELGMGRLVSSRSAAQIRSLKALIL